MDYIELNVPVTGSEQAEIVTAMLADLPSTVLPRSAAY